MSKATTRESAVLRDVSAYFRASGWLVVRTQAGTSRGGRMHHAPKGFPDLACFGPGGRVALVEVKRGDGMPRVEQAKMHGELTARGHAVWVVRGVEDAVAVVTGRQR